VKVEKTAFSTQKTTFEPATPCRESRRRTPKLRLHKATGQGYAVLNGRYIFFGLYGTDEATREYHETIAE
jgi:hypothetical protein